MKPNVTAAITISNAKVRVIPTHKFATNLENNAEVLRWLCEVYSSDARMLAVHAAGLGASTVRQRLEEYLYQLSASRAPSNVCHVRLPFTQERVARLLSTHVGYLNATLKDLELEDLIKREPRGILIRQRSKLWHRVSGE